MRECNEARLARTNFESLGGKILIKQDVLLLIKLYRILSISQYCNSKFSILPSQPNGVIK